MSAPSLDHAGSMSTSGYEDGLGRRTLTFDREAGGMLERLHLRPELAAFELALRDRMAHLAPFEDERFARVGAIERDSDGTLVVVSGFVGGIRVSDLLDGADGLSPAGEASPGVDVALGFLLEVLPALSALHARVKVAHGAVAPGRIILTPAGQVVLLDSLFGQALERLQFTRRRLWNDFQIAAGPASGPHRFDAGADVAQAMLTGMMLVLGRTFREDEITNGMTSLLSEVVDIAQIRGSNTLGAGLRRVLERTLPLTSDRPHVSADDATAQVRQLAGEIGLPACAAALGAFAATVEENDPIAEPDAFEASPGPSAPQPQPVVGRQPSPVIVVPDPEPEPDIHVPAAPSRPVADDIPTDDDEVLLTFDAEPPAQEMPLAEQPAEAEPVVLSAEPDALLEMLASLQTPDPIEPEPLSSAPTAPEPILAEPILPEPYASETLIAEPTLPDPIVPEPIAFEPAAAETFVAAEIAPPAFALPEPFVQTAPPVYVPEAPAPTAEPRSEFYLPPDPLTPTAAAPPFEEAAKPQESPAPTAPTSSSRRKEKKKGKRGRDKLRSAAAPVPKPVPPPIVPPGSLMPGGRTSDPLHPDVAPFQPVPVLAPQAPAPLIVSATAPVRVKAEPPTGYTPVTPRYDREISAMPYVERGPTDEPKSAFPWKLAAAVGAVMVIGVVGGRYFLMEHKTAEKVEAVKTAAAAPAPEPPPATTGSVEIVTQPAGTRVLLDGKVAGETPVTFDDLAPGRHTITFTTPTGSLKRVVKIEAGKKLSLDVPVYSGWVAVFSPIPVDITENGRAIGTSEQGRLMLPPGRHQLAFSNREHGYNSAQTVDIEPGEERGVTLQPVGELNANALPWAEVWIDGNKVGETPIAGLKVPLGTHEIVFKHPQFGERRVTATVTATAAAAVSADFTKQ